MNKEKYFLIGLLCVTLIASCLGCGKKKNYNDGKTYYSVQEEQQQKVKSQITNMYDATMTAVVKYNNKEVGIVILLDSSTGEEYTMTYNDNVQVIDRYGADKNISYLNNGDIIKAYYLKNAIQLTGVEYTNDVWEYTQEENWEIDTEDNSISVGGEQYYYNANQLYIISEGNCVEFQDLHPQDLLAIRGIGKQVISVNVDRGHGYIRLLGVDNFIDGWVQVGKSIKPVTKDMLLVAPEGTYDVKITKEGYGGSVNATVPRNGEVSVDFSDVASKIVKYGTVEFIITPEDANATLTISGKETSYLSPVLLEYNTYNVTVEAEGYETYKGKLKVGQNLSQVKIKLTKESTSASPSKSPTVSPSVSPSVTPQTSPSSTLLLVETPKPQSSSDSKIITVTDPEGANVYFDDEYKGVAPVSFQKVGGSHTLTLSKDGYQTKSYSIDISESDDNVTYCMPALVQETN